MGRLTKRVDGEVQENHDNDANAGEWRAGNKFRNGSRACLEKLAVYEEAEEQGLLVKLPCKVGSLIHVLNDGGGYYSCYVKRIEQLREQSGPIMLATCGLSDGSVFQFLAVEENKGIRWFDTEEEAEAALKEQCQQLKKRLK